MYPFCIFTNINKSFLNFLGLRLRVRSMLRNFAALKKATMNRIVAAPLMKFSTPFYRRLLQDICPGLVVYTEMVMDQVCLEQRHYL